MTIKELKEILNQYPDNTEIVLASDSEGNKYSPLAGYSNGKYEPETTWRGEFYSADEADEFNGQDAIALYPVN